MNIPTIETALARLEASPVIAAQFDAASKGKTRRQAVTDCITQLVKISDEKSRLKSEIAATKANVAALEMAKKTKASAPVKTAAKNVLQAYQAMPSGAAKIAFLREHAVAIQTLSKSTK